MDNDCVVHTVAQALAGRVPRGTQEVSSTAALPVAQITAPHRNRDQHSATVAALPKLDPWRLSGDSPGSLGGLLPASAVNENQIESSKKQKPKQKIVFCRKLYLSYCVALKNYFIHFMLALFRPLCWCFMPWLYSGLYTESLYHGFILGFILGFMSLGRGVSVASVASGPVVATAGAHRWAR